MSTGKKEDLETTQSVDVEDDRDNEGATDFHQFAAQDASAIVEMAGEARAGLVALTGLNIGATFFLEGEKILVGRGKDCGLCITGGSISRHHAEIVKLGNGRWEVRDLGSTNGTFVEKKRVEAKILAEGDRVVFGDGVAFKVVYQDHLEQSYQKVLFASSVRDPLTQAHNRKFLDEKIVTDHAYCRRHVSPLSVLLIDVDNFKTLNTTYGSQTGDMALKLITSTTMTLIGPDDTLGRHDTEAFAIIAPGTDLVGAEELAEKIQTSISELVLESVDDPSQTCGVTVTIGVVTAEIPIECHSDELFAKAASNLAQAQADAHTNLISSLILSR